MPESPTRVARIAAFMTRHRLAVLLVFALLAIAVSYGALHIKTDIIFQHMFPHDHPYLKLHAKFSRIFGSGGSGVVIGIKAKDGDIFNQKMLGKIEKITREIELWDEIYRSLTVSIASNASKVVRTLAGGEILIKSLMFPETPQNQEQMEQLKRDIFSNPAYDGILVSRDGTASLIFTEFKENISYEQAFAKLKGLKEKYEDENTSLQVVGYPMLMGWIYSLKYQMHVVFAVSIACIILILLLIFRNVIGILAPLAVGVISTGLGLGFIGWAGINFSPLLFVLGFLVSARQVSHSVQITCRYMEELNQSGGQKQEACYQTMRGMLVPNVAGVVTDAAGFAVLYFAQIVLMQQLALIMTVWMLGIASTAILTPIICSYIPLTGASQRWSKDRLREGFLDRLCVGAAQFSIGRGKMLVSAGVLVLAVFCAWQMNYLKIGDPTPGSPLLWPDHRYNQDQALLNQKFDASSENLTLYFEGEPGSVYDPRVLNTFERFSTHMAQALPDIYKSSSSIIDLVKILNLTLRDGDQLRYQLPTDREELEGLLGYLKNTASMAQLRRFIDQEMSQSMITLFFADHTSDNLLRINQAAQEFFAQNPAQIEVGQFKLAGGRVGMEIAVNQEMKESHLLIDAMVLATILIMCAISFRSLVAGLMLTIPLVLSNMVAFAYMAMADIGLSINTLPVAAVGVGVGVDFSIYLYSRLEEEFPRHRRWGQAIRASVSTSGKAIVYTGITMIVSILPWYFLSAMKFQAQMGFFLSMLLLMNVILALTLHPLLLTVIRPRFITRHADQAAEKKFLSKPKSDSSRPGGAKQPGREAWSAELAWRTTTGTSGGTRKSSS